MNYKFLKQKRPNFKPVISEEIKVYLKGDSTYYTARNKKHASKIAEQLKTQAENEWNEFHDKERFNNTISGRVDFLLSQMLNSLDGRRDTRDMIPKVEIKAKIKKIFAEAEKWAEEHSE